MSMLTSLLQFLGETGEKVSDNALFNDLVFSVLPHRLLLNLIMRL